MMNHLSVLIGVALLSLIWRICLKQVREAQRVADFNFELAELNALENQAEAA